ncbi:MAG: hypothetical protein EXS16_15790 [Gemmataceae bacterium]|nr:hypothetical protein [Gemmataceae bacterium]
MHPNAQQFVVRPAAGFFGTIDMQTAPNIWRTLVNFDRFTTTRVRGPQMMNGLPGNQVQIASNSALLPSDVLAVETGDGDDTVELEFLASVVDASIQIDAGLGNDSAVIQHGVIPTNQVTFVGLENLTVAGDASMAGELVIGGSGLAGNLNLVNYTQTSYGQLHIDLGFASTSDLLIVSGAVTLVGMLDLFVLTEIGNNTYTLIDNLGPSPIVGNFNNLAEGTVITLAASTYSISYVGGDGNDVVLQRTGTITSLA